MSLPSLTTKEIDEIKIERPGFTYYENGKVKVEKIVLDKDIYLKEIHYNEKGQISEIINYRKDGSIYCKNDLTHEVMKTGLAFTYYDNGKVQSLKYFVGGRINWEEKIFDDEGQLMEVVTYRQGVKSGPHVIYNRKNNLKVSEINYKDNIPNGKALFFYENGEIKAEVNFKDGKRNGVSKIFFKNGTLKIQEDIVDDKRNGMTEAYYESGGLKERWNFMQGFPESNCTFYYSSGSLYATRNFYKGKEEGPQKKFYESGKIMEEANFKNGELTGTFKQYAENGEVIKEIIYDSGETIVVPLKGRIKEPAKQEEPIALTRKQKVKKIINYSLLFLTAMLIVYIIFNLIIYFL
ncbi:MAG: toxin-antitoxin system YwqK family antitoxin [Ignavibacteria bacterium]|jgi:antitoxin component YwqK of YwqJK toxin-antitoxin module